MKNYYDVLGLNSDADARAIRKAWLTKAQQLHPDHNPDDPTSEELFKEAQEAYRILSDPFLRRRYDDSGFHGSVSGPPVYEAPVNYFRASLAVASVLQFDEMEVEFRYTGRGRMFRRPAFKGFFITGPPYISHRLVIADGHQVRETTFRYVVCPVEPGILTVGRAGITIGSQSLFTEPMTVEVQPALCHFMKDARADGKPLKVTLHHDFEGQESKAPLSENKKNHTVLVPRSRTAYIFHSIGMAMKIVFMIWGAIMLKSYFGVPMFFGAMAGALLGGMNVMILYAIAGVRSKCRHARRYAVVQRYLDRGYKLGESTGFPLVKSSGFYELQKLVF